MRKEVVLVMCLGLIGWGTGVALGETIYACVHNNTGNVRIVSMPGTCKTIEHEVSWREGDDLEQAVNSLTARIEAVETMLGVFNEPPVVDCGDDLVTLISNPLSLSPSATDDGVKQPLTYWWSVLDGPQGEDSHVIFVPNQTSQTVEVWFGEPGTYELEFSAYDGFVSVGDSLFVTVGTGNTGPSIVVEHVFPIVDDDGYGFQCASNVYFTILDDGFPAPATVDGSTLSANISPPDTALTWSIPPYVEEIAQVGGTGGEREFRAITNSFIYGVDDWTSASYDLVIVADDGSETATETVSVVCEPSEP